MPFSLSPDTPTVFASLGRVLLLIMLLFGLSVVTGCQRETAKWEYAKGLNEYEAGDLESAVTRMRHAISQRPNDVRMKLGLAEVLAKMGDRRSLEYCDEVLKVMPNSESALFRKSLCLQHFGEFEDALAVYKKVLARRLNRTTVERNNLAYFRALARKELMLAASDIEKAIDEEEQRRWPSGIYLPLTVKSNMANAVVSRRLGRQRQAGRKLTRQIQKLEKDYARIRSLLSLTVFAQIQGEFPLPSTTEKEMHLLRNNQDLIRGCLASLLTVRALLFQDLEKVECSNADRIRIRELGFDSNELASQLPDENQCMDALNIAMTYLDTRGYVLGLLPWDDAGFESQGIARTDPRFRVSGYDEAIEDLNFAVDAVNTYRLGLKSRLTNLPEQPVEMVETAQQLAKRTEAVIRYHRLLVHERAGNKSAGKRDRQRIETLGMEPGPNLF